MKYPKRPCPIDRCTDHGAAPHGLCPTHLPLLPGTLTEQLCFAVRGLYVATPADAALFLGQPFTVVERELRVLASMTHAPIAKAVKLVLDRAAQHVLPTRWPEEDQCCARCGTLVRRVDPSAPVEYFVGGPDDWRWTATAPPCRPYADAIPHAFTWTVGERPSGAGNEWMGVCAHCPVKAKSIHDPQGGAPPRIRYQVSTGSPWVPTVPSCPPRGEPSSP